MLVHGRVHDAGSRVDRRQAAPEFLPILWKRIIGAALVREPGSAAFFGRPDDVIAGVRESVGVEAAVVVPLRTDARKAVPAVVRQPKNMLVAAGRGRVHAVSAVQFLATPPRAGAEEIVGRDLLFALEDKKAPLGHL